MRFSQGDSVQFVIKQQKIGTVKEVLYVPPSVMDYSLAPSLSLANEFNTNTIFELGWDPVDANYCAVEGYGYNEWETLLTRHILAMDVHGHHDSSSAR